MYWDVSSFPELEHLSDKDREQVVRQANATGVTIRLVVRSIIVGALVGGPLTFVLLGSFVPLRQPALAGIVFSFMLLVVTLGLYQFQIIRIRGQLRIYLEQMQRQRRLPMCLNCGYSLEGLTGDCCPECGRNVTPP